MSNFTKLNALAVLFTLAVFALTLSAVSVDWYQSNKSFSAYQIQANPTVYSDILYAKQWFNLDGATTRYKTLTIPSGTYSFRPGTSDIAPAGVTVAAAESSTTGIHTYTATGTGNIATIMANISSTTSAASSVEQSSTYVEYSKDSMSAVWNLVKLAQGLAILALILSAIAFLLLLLCFASSIRNKLLFWLGMNVMRVIFFTLAFIIVICLVATFLAFLGITDAFDSDLDYCNVGYCKRFQDRSYSRALSASAATYTLNAKTAALTSTGATFYQGEETFTFGPAAGWYLILAAIPCSVLLLIVVAVNKFPIPVDSNSAFGEAL
jgi:hypothetical protein